MDFDQKIAPGDRVAYLEMTPERKERMGRVAHEIVTLCRRELESPMEAHATIQCALEALEDNFHIKASCLMNEEIQ